MTENPFAAPSADIEAGLEMEGRIHLEHLDFKSLTKMRNHS